LLVYMSLLTVKKYNGGTNLITVHTLMSDLICFKPYGVISCILNPGE